MRKPVIPDPPFGLTFQQAIEWERGYRSFIGGLVPIDYMCPAWVDGWLAAWSEVLKALDAAVGSVTPAISREYEILYDYRRRIAAALNGSKPV